MSSPRRYLLLEQGLGSGIFNFVLNAGIAWGMFRRAASVPLWGQQSIAADTLGTCFFLPFFTGLMVTRIARRHVRAGHVRALGWSRRTHRVLRWLPTGTAGRALALGLLAVVTVGASVVALLSRHQVEAWSLWSFVLFKAAFAAALAVVVTPLIALWAIAEGDPRAAG